MLLLTNARVLAPDEHWRGWVAIEEGRIHGLGPGDPPGPAPQPAVEVRDLAGAWLAPGYVDTHVHGGGGGDFQTGDLLAAQRAVDYHRSQGTTTMLASVVTAPLPELVASVAALAAVIDAGDLPGLAGIHLEGPFLADARCGAHDPALLRDPDPEAVSSLLEAGRGRVAMVTLAPERAGGLDAIRRITDAGAVGAIGHTNATYADAVAAIDAGARVATHLFNGMPPLHHREPGPLLALVADERVTVELISDGAHLHPSLVRELFRWTGRDRTVLVSDAIALTGTTGGRMRLGSLEVTVVAGVAMTADGRSLAGSAQPLSAGVAHSVAAGVDLVDAVRAATQTPADRFGLSESAGRIQVGAPADLVVLDDLATVHAVMAGGQWVSRPS